MRSVCISNGASKAHVAVLGREAQVLHMGDLESIRDFEKKLEL